MNRCISGGRVDIWKGRDVSWQDRTGAGPTPESEATMATLTKAEALTIIRRAYGSDVADSVAGRLPDRIDPDSHADAELLSRLGLTRDGLVDALGGDL